MKNSLSAPQVAKIFKRARATIYEWAARGYLKFERDEKGYYRFDKKEVEAKAKIAGWPATLRQQRDGSAKQFPETAWFNEAKHEAIADPLACSEDIETWSVKAGELIVTFANGEAATAIDIDYLLYVLPKYNSFVRKVYEFRDRYAQA